MTIHPKYITDETGKRLAVQLSIADWENIVLELQNLALKQPKKNTRKQNKIKQAVEILKDDYLTDKELTVFSGVDTDEIYDYPHETR